MEFVVFSTFRIFFFTIKYYYFNVTIKTLACQCELRNLLMFDKIKSMKQYPYDMLKYMRMYRG